MPLIFDPFPGPVRHDLRQRWPDADAQYCGGPQLSFGIIERITGTTSIVDFVDGAMGFFFAYSAIRMITTTMTKAATPQ